jgi:hypothetical protein
MIATLEESLEMAGLIMFIGALLEYCSDNYRVGHFGFGGWLPKGDESLQGTAQTP